MSTQNATSTCLSVETRDRLTRVLSVTWRGVGESQSKEAGSSERRRNEQKKKEEEEVETNTPLQPMRVMYSSWRQLMAIASMTWSDTLGTLLRLSFLSRVKAVSANSASSLRCTQPAMPSSVSEWPQCCASAR